MALIKTTATDTVSLGALAAATIFTAKRGSFGLSTDAGTVDEDYFTLSEGMSLSLPGGVTATYRALSFGAKNSVGQAEAWLHYMPG